jgi:hypothetical protein
MTCCRCSAPALIQIPGVAGWCKVHAQPLAEFSAQRLAELESRNQKSRRDHLSSEAAA